MFSDNPNKKQSLRVSHKSNGYIYPEMAMAGMHQAILRKHKNGGDEGGDLAQEARLQVRPKTIFKG